MARPTIQPNLFSRGTVERTCACGSAFTTTSARINEGRGKYCSKRCSQRACGLALHAKHDLSGPNNPAWKGGISKHTTKYKDAFRARYPEKAKAHDLTAAAIRAGTLVRQPCEACGTPKADAHHDDYSKPLKVRWLCRPCHHSHHRNAA